MARKPRAKQGEPSARAEQGPRRRSRRSRRTRAAAESPYHHGALRDALLQAAEKRAGARRACRA